MADPAPSPPNPPPDPAPGSGNSGGPRRIRSLPDRAVRPRPSGGVRSVPERAPISTRLPGTDADSYGGDMNWRRGIAVLWLLFVLIAAGEAAFLFIYLLGGGNGWPGILDVLRLTVLCGVFVTLWFGWGWTHWVLAGVAFLVGLRTVLVSALGNYHGINAETMPGTQAVGTWLILGIGAATGLLYLILSVYLVFSADVIAFTRHRQEEGRPWVVVPVALLVGCYWVAMLGAQFVLYRELEGTRPEMLRLARQDAENMATRWDPDSIATFLDAESLKGWPDAGRQNIMNLLRPLGSYLGPGEESSSVLIVADRLGTSSFIHGTCQETVRCTEGRATFYFVLQRPLSGPWRVVDFSMGNLRFYNPPAPPKPAATPTLQDGGRKVPTPRPPVRG